MSDRFHQISMEQLTDWVFDELEQQDAIFGVPRSAFFVPSPDDRFRLEKYGYELETPFGVAAGPHTQMAQNIIVSWLVGARFIELKTVQTLDELEIAKPCIDVRRVNDDRFTVAVWRLERHLLQQPLHHGVKTTRTDVLGALVDSPRHLGDARNRVGRERERQALCLHQRLILLR